MFYLLIGSKMDARAYERLGYSDRGDIFIKRIGERIQLLRYCPVDYQYMEEYIDDRVDMRSEWQEDVWNGNTEEGFDEWRQDYSYCYEDYFTYDVDLDEYYDDNDDDYLFDSFYTKEYSKEEVVERVMEYFDDDYSSSNFERIVGMNDTRLRELIERYYDDALEYVRFQEEEKKPHWNVFNYYK